MEALLREAAARGLTHLSVYPVHSADRKTVYWHATANTSVTAPMSKASGLDIVEVVAQVLQGMKKAPLRKFDSVNPPISEMAQRENQGTLPIDAIPGKETEDGGNVTAAVTRGFEDFLPRP